jgi:hypothetical protein
MIMTDDIKNILQNINWPKHSPMLSPRILNMLDDDTTLPMHLVFSTPLARYSFGLGMLGCIAAGLFVAPWIAAQSTIPWLSTNMGLIYYFSI